MFLCIVFLFGQVSQFIPAAKSWPSGWNFPQHLQEPGPDPLFLASHILTPHSNFQKFYLKRPKIDCSFYCSQEFVSKAVFLQHQAESKTAQQAGGEKLMLQVQVSARDRGSCAKQQIQYISSSHEISVHFLQLLSFTPRSKPTSMYKTHPVPNLSCRRLSVPHVFDPLLFCPGFKEAPGASCWYCPPEDGLFQGVPRSSAQSLRCLPFFGGFPLSSHPNMQSSALHRDVASQLGIGT